MKVELLTPDIAPAPPARVADANAFASALDAVSSALGGATKAEDAYASGTGSLQEAAYRRAQADITLSVATAAVQRVAQAVQSLMNLQI